MALCFGWIDGQKQAHSEQYWLQQFTPRSDKSVWSKINKAKALALIKAGKMKPAGLNEVERAKRDGRWDAAYDSAGKSVVPGDFQSALNGNARARDFFAKLDSRNRYAVVFRIQTAKTADVRAKANAESIDMGDLLSQFKVESLDDLPQYQFAAAYTWLGSTVAS